MNNLEKVNINDNDQWILVRGDEEAPLLIHVQAGPGFPMIPEANAMKKLFRFEEDHLVAYWDQRGCGKSFNKSTDPKTINFSQLPDDLIVCTKYLLTKYKKKKAILVGYSIGATVGLMAASKERNLFSRLFLVGIDIDIPSANKSLVEFTLAKAKERNNNKWMKEAVELSETKITETKAFQRRAKLLTNLGGINIRSNYNQLLKASITGMLFSKSYRLSDIPRTIQGMEFCQNALLPELDTLNLFDRIKSIDVPVHFIQGKQDAVAPYQIGLDYYKYLQAREKTFTAFEHSAHMPHYEEPGKFTATLRETLKKDMQTTLVMAKENN